MAMKPIPTRYKGYNFRSRLEARWAVFFDSLGMEWEYEPEGFQLSDGSRYLPDFKVEGRYLEVKATREDDFSKAKQLAKDSDEWVICVAGNPSTITYPVAMPDGYMSDVIISAPCNKYGPFYWATGLNGYWQDWRHLGRIKEEPVLEAIEAARSARFEFGESGATV